MIETVLLVVVDPCWVVYYFADGQVCGGWVPTILNVAAVQRCSFCQCHAAAAAVWMDAVSFVLVAAALVEDGCLI